MDVTIAGASFPGYNYAGSTARLRIYASQTFTASDGSIVGGGTAGSTTGFYTTVNCTVVSNVLTCPSVTLKSTTDALTGRDTVYTVVLFDASGTQRDFFPLSSFWLSQTAGSTQTWGQIASYNEAATRPPAEGSYTTGQTDAAIQAQVNVGNPATTTNLGRARLNIPPADAASPVVVGANDPRLAAPVAVDVSKYAAAGAGTSLSPWTGWETATPWAARTAYYFAPGYYAAATFPNWGAYADIRLLGSGAGSTILKHTGSGSAVQFIGSGPDGAYGGSLQDIEIQGNASTTNGVEVEKAQHLTIRNVKVRDVSLRAFYFKFTIASLFENIRYSENENAVTVRPQNGIVTDQDANGNPVQDCQFINVIVEHTAADGIVLNHTNQTQWLGGTSEGNAGKGLLVNATSTGNTFIGMDNESNASDDFTIYGHYNRFINLYSTGTFRVKAGAKRNSVQGGQFNTFLEDSGALYSRYEHLNYNLLGTGSISLPSATREVVGGLYDIWNNTFAGASAGLPLMAYTTLDFPSTPAGGYADLTVTVPGAALTDVADLGPTHAAVLGNTEYKVWVSAADTVTVRLFNHSASAIDPVNAFFRVIVWHF